MSKRSYRIGQIVPSSNVTMETEIPAIFRQREGQYSERFTFHSSRMRMKHVTPEALAAMDVESDRCALELSDAAVDVMGYACLVAIMAQGLGYHRVSQARLENQALSNDSAAPVITSAGALVDGLHAMGAKKVAIITPYMKPLTAKVVAYLEHEGIEVQEALSLEIADNLEVAAQNPLQPLALAQKLALNNVDAIVGSACVQMPSLPSIQLIQDKTGVPTLSAALATGAAMMQALGLAGAVPGLGALFETCRADVA
ncbi:Asp/Glu racemase [Litorivicinus lipolyticus]|uniref:Maleate isomerase n=1 Tax=Litorivicinus lipolyticus TaxID=418701 RepID=A0A5Q2QAE9_9GAMM|nr:Asp/Glu racemase [Litorivicinus lipolyticus]QGG79251.1 Asp/Glu racemase [Litorivicinus lipolyticus]